MIRRGLTYKSVNRRIGIDFELQAETTYYTHFKRIVSEFLYNKETQPNAYKINTSDLKILQDMSNEQLHDYSGRQTLMPKVCMYVAKGILDGIKYAREESGDNIKVDIDEKDIVIIGSDNDITKMFLEKNKKTEVMSGHRCAYYVMIVIAVIRTRFYYTNSYLCELPRFNGFGIDSVINDPIHQEHGLIIMLITLMVIQYHSSIDLDTDETLRNIVSELSIVLVETYKDILHWSRSSMVADSILEANKRINYTNSVICKIQNMIMSRWDAIVLAPPNLFCTIISADQSGEQNIMRVGDYTISVEMAAVSDLSEIMKSYIDKAVLSNSSSYLRDFNRAQVLMTSKGYKQNIFPLTCSIIVILICITISTVVVCVVYGKEINYIGADPFSVITFVVFVEGLVLSIFTTVYKENWSWYDFFRGNIYHDEMNSIVGYEKLKDISKSIYNYNIIQNIILHNRSLLQFYNRDQACYVGHEANGVCELPQRIHTATMLQLNYAIYSTNIGLYYGELEGERWVAEINNEAIHVLPRASGNNVSIEDLCLGNKMIAGTMVKIGNKKC